jgi:hypothetical protein
MHRTSPWTASTTPDGRCVAPSDPGWIVPTSGSRRSCLPTKKESRSAARTPTAAASSRSRSPVHTGIPTPVRADTPSNHPAQAAEVANICHRTLGGPRRSSSARLTSLAVGVSPIDPLEVAPGCSPSTSTSLLASLPSGCSSWSRLCSSCCSPRCRWGGKRSGGGCRVNAEDDRSLAGRWRRWRSLDASSVRPCRRAAGRLLLQLCAALATRSHRYSPTAVWHRPRRPPSAYLSTLAPAHLNRSTDDNRTALSLDRRSATPRLPARDPR